MPGHSTALIITSATDISRHACITTNKLASHNSVLFIVIKESCGCYSSVRFSVICFQFVLCFEVCFTCGGSTQG